MTKQYETKPMTQMQADDIELKTGTTLTAIEPFDPELSEGDSENMRRYSDSWNEMAGELEDFIDNNPNELPVDLGIQNFKDARARRRRMIPINAKLAIINKIAKDMMIVDGHIITNTIDNVYSYVCRQVKNGKNKFKELKDKLALLYKKNNLNPPTVMPLAPSQNLKLSTHKPGSRLINSGNTVIEMHIGAIVTTKPTKINPFSSVIIPLKATTILIINLSTTDEGEITFRLNSY